MHNDIATLLKTRRKELNLSVKVVLDRLRAYGVEISDKTLYGWESGYRQPDADTFLVLCQIYGVDSLANISGAKKEAPSDLSEEALKMARRYNSLDGYGKTMVQVVVAQEEKRVQEEDAARRAKELYYDEADEFGEHSDPRVIPLYFTPAAAGFASPAFGEDFEYINVEGDVPRQADFAVRIDGASMEPYIMDESVVYVSREPLTDGDVGIFFVDGDMLCKQYSRDRRGNIHLRSLNRDYAGADRFIDTAGEYTFTCYGRVVLPERPKIVIE